MTNHDKIIIESIWPSSNSRPRRHFLLNLKKYPNIVEYIENRYEYIENLREGIDRLKNGIEKRPVCKHCGKMVTYRGVGVYSEYCSNECSFIHTNDDRKKTWIKKYGCDNPAKNKEIQEKAIKTSLDRYGVKNGGWSEKAKKKIFASNRNKLGVDMPLQSKEVRDKISNTILNRYGADNYMRSEDYKEKSKSTCNEKYGVDNPLNSEEIQNKIKKSLVEKYGYPSFMSTKEFRRKSVETCIKKYGVRYPIQFKEIRDKIDDTKRKNHTFNTSKPEENIYILLKENFPEVVRQHKDKERYPWNCDFFIPSVDIFIELQGMWTHNKHPYDYTSIEDQRILEEWKSKESKFYENAVHVWSISDVKKRETAKKNHLHWIEFFTYDEDKIMREIENYIEDIKNGYEGIRTVL